jgi:hypothetical protein
MVGRSWAWSRRVCLPNRGHELFGAARGARSDAPGDPSRQSSVGPQCLRACAVHIAEGHPPGKVGSGRGRAWPLRRKLRVAVGCHAERSRHSLPGHDHPEPVDNASATSPSGRHRQRRDPLDPSVSNAHRAGPSRSSTSWRRSIRFFVRTPTATGSQHPGFEVLRWSTSVRTAPGRTRPNTLTMPSRGRH